MKKIDPLIVDVRPIFEKGGSPCGLIDSSVAKLEEGQELILLAPFEPHPLFAKLGREGFSHRSEKLPDGSWRIVFGKTVSPTGLSKRAAPHDGKVSPPKLPDQKENLFLDTRDMEPPLPLVRTLETLTELKKGCKLVMRSNRKPIHLFEQLEERGFAYECTQQGDQHFSTEIWHANISRDS